MTCEVPISLFWERTKCGSDRPCRIDAWRSDMPSRGQCPGPPPPAPAERMPTSINACIGFSRRELMKIVWQGTRSTTRLDSERTTRSKSRVPDKAERSKAIQRPSRSIETPFTGLRSARSPSMVAAVVISVPVSIFSVLVGAKGGAAGVCRGETFSLPHRPLCSKVVLTISDRRTRHDEDHGGERKASDDR